MTERETWRRLDLRLSINGENGIFNQLLISKKKDYNQSRRTEAFPFPCLRIDLGPVSEPLTAAALPKTPKAER